MKISELIEKLKEYPQDFEVVIAKDEEGNGFSPMRDLSFGEYDNDDEEFHSWITNWSEGTETLRTLEESNALCLWP